MEHHKLTPLLNTCFPFLTNEMRTIAAFPVLSRIQISTLHTLFNIFSVIGIDISRVATDALGNT